MDRFERVTDLDPEERAIHRVLSAVPPQPLPLGFRDTVMRRIDHGGVRLAWEWTLAAALAVPSALFLAWALAVSGADFGDAFATILRTAQALTDASDAVFFVDGLVVLAFALLGVASLVSTHALVQSSLQPRRRTTIR